LISKTATPENKFLEDRISALENRVAHLESLSDDSILEDWKDHAYNSIDIYGELVSPEAMTKPVRNKMGAPKKMTDEAFEKRRDQYVYFVEALWPEFEEVLSTTVEVSEFEAKLRLRFPARGGDPLFQMLLKSVHEFHRYLRNKRFTGEPRQMAYVLAGLSGGLSWTYSLVRGIKKPSKQPIHFRSMREHIRRHHPAWYRNLMEKGSQEMALHKVPKGCRECKRFNEWPACLIPALQVRAFPLEKPAQLIVIESPMGENGSND